MTNTLIPTSADPKEKNSEHSSDAMSVSNDVESNSSIDSRRNKAQSETSDSPSVDSVPAPASAEEDPWAIVELVDNSEKWEDMSTKAKVIRVVTNVSKILAAIGLLYFFICSLDLLSSAFRLISGKTAGTIFQQSELMQNPVVGLMIGILVTVLVQSSSTSTSIIVSMVGAGVLTVAMAIPIIMGANIGTSVTNTIVSFTQIGNKNEFRRAFAGATVHDMFNWLTVIVLFIVEVVCQPIFGVGYLEWLSGVIVNGVNTSSGEGEIKILTVVTDPFVDLIIQLDSKVLKGWANDDPRYENASLIQQCGGNVTDPIPCDGEFLFEDTGMEDWAVGLILLAISLIILCSCLIFLVKILNSMMQGHIANVIKRVINAKIPYVPWLTGYIALAVGAGMTFIVQSSSVFTSALTPLVGIGVISLERVYPLTLGSNIGTTTTALLAALAASPDALHDTLQISLVHLCFNVTGILLFYPIPFMRFPIPMAKFLGNETAKYRWFAILYLVGMFFFLPAIVLGLSIAGTIALLVVGVPVLIVLIAIAVIKILQRKWPFLLPSVMRDWKWLPVGCRSLEPYDRQFAKCACCNKFRQGEDSKENNTTSSVVLVESESSTDLNQTT
ncbi:sodium-dependent phosphate transport protein 2B-like [Daphnia carinata]|uniref:sodium-dependent phosphate transport protein 2B-like n=1 Tax=Daphnia carinata TaxID=120202 RepID=UPI00257FD3B6|nr:sodium-dependent phosphate transport protein 2B-like [Daphnia carinata]